MLNQAVVPASHLRSNLKGLPSKLWQSSIEYRNGLGYHQPAGALSAMGVMASGTGATQSKYVARRETPVYIAENCTQCMECITACPDTALPNTSQDVETILSTAARNYINNPEERVTLLQAIPEIESQSREQMVESADRKSVV